MPLINAKYRVLKGFPSPKNIPIFIFNLDKKIINMQLLLTPSLMKNNDYILSVYVS